MTDLQLYKEKRKVQQTDKKIFSENHSIGVSEQQIQTGKMLVHSDKVTTVKTYKT